MGVCLVTCWAKAEVVRSKPVAISLRQLCLISSFLVLFQDWIESRKTVWHSSPGRPSEQSPPPDLLALQIDCFSAARRKPAGKLRATALCGGRAAVFSVSAPHRASIFEPFLL